MYDMCACVFPATCATLDGERERERETCFRMSAVRACVERKNKQAKKKGEKNIVLSALLYSVASVDTPPGSGFENCDESLLHVNIISTGPALFS